MKTQRRYETTWSEAEYISSWGVEPVSPNDGSPESTTVWELLTTQVCVVPSIRIGEPQTVYLFWTWGEVER